MNFDMVVTVTVTVTDADRPPDAAAAVEQTSGTAGPATPRLRRPDTAFAASLPLGLVLPRHILLPSEIREAL